MKSFQTRGTSMRKSDVKTSAAADLAKATNDVAAAIAAFSGHIKDSRAVLDERRRALVKAQNAFVPLDEVEKRIPGVVAAIGDDWMAREGQHVLNYDSTPSAWLGGATFTGHASLPDMSRDFWGLLCAAEPQRAVDMLTAIVRRTTYEAGTYSHERQQLVDRLAAELRALEAEEEAMVDAAVAAGLNIAHRPEVTTRRDNEDNAERLARARKAEWERQPHSPAYSGHGPVTETLENGRVVQHPPFRPSGDSSS